MTNENNHDGSREFVEHWKRVGPLLEKIRHDELRNMRHEDQAENIDSLLEAGLQHGQPTNMSGLVEMQRIFARARQ